MADPILVYASWDPTDIKKVRPEELKQAEELGYLPTKPTADEPTIGDARSRAATKGFTLGLGDEAAGFGAYLGAASGKIDPEVERQQMGEVLSGKRGALDYLRDHVQRQADARSSGSEARREARDAYRAEDKRVKGAHPDTFGRWELAGAIGSGIAVPAKAMTSLPGAMKAGAVLEGIRGVGEAEELEDVPGEALKHGAVGALGGALGYGIGQVAKKGASKVVPRLQERFADAAERVTKRADARRVLTSMGATGGSINGKAVLKEVERVPGGIPEVARIMRETPGVAPTLGRTSTIQRASEKAADEAQEVIQSVIKAVDEAGEKVDAKRFANRLREEAIRLQKESGENESVVDALIERAKLYETRFGNGVTMSQAQVIKNQLGSNAGWRQTANGAPVSDPKLAKQIATRAWTEMMDDAAARAFATADNTVEANTAKRVFPRGTPEDPLEVYRGARRVNQAMRILEEAGEENLLRADGNRIFGLLPTLSGGAGASAGAALGGPAGAFAGTVGGIAAQKLASAYGASARASSAEAAAALLRRAPERLGRAGEALVEASRRGGPALAATYQRLRLTEPGFAERADAILAEEQQTQTKAPRTSMDSLAPLLGR